MFVRTPQTYASGFIYNAVQNSTVIVLIKEVSLLDLGIEIPSLAFFDVLYLTPQKIDEFMVYSNHYPWCTNEETFCFKVQFEQIKNQF